ncbi:MAG: N-acetylmuramoyl-L-alanine amidase [Clostridia bacterium]|nr:N-acetylmuramoyl-L-alanine amidase [Clostridia bacterium]
MKRFILLLLPLLLASCSAAPAAVVPSPSPAPPPTPLFSVALDFGHGGFDGGAVGVDTGVIEATLNLAIGNMVKTLLEDSNIEVVLTRPDENAIGDTKNEDMHRRSEILSSESLDLVVSIHMNKFSDRSVRGPMVYYQAGSEAGQLLAQTLMDSLTAATDRNSRLASPGDNLVTRVPSAPAALVECGFLSHPEEELLLQDSDYQALLARAIADGILSYLGILAGQNGQTP